MKFRIIISILIFLACIRFQTDAKKGWQSLFNGKNLDGWDTYIGSEFNGNDDWSQWTKGPRLGLNNDPKKVFSVVEIDGKPVLRVSGERFGGISTTQEFENYHLQLQFKWGKNKFEPKLKNARDSGLLYHGTGDHGADSGFWLRSQEFQIQEGDTGDYWGCAGAIFDVNVSRSSKGFVYDPSGMRLHFREPGPNGRHVIKSKGNEKPSGEWNTIDLYCFEGTAVHVINGVTNLVLNNSSQRMGDSEIPLTKGKIQIQCEGAEIFYKNIKIKQISSIPKKILK